ncbi:MULTISPECIES: holin [Gammaproteobacteria]|uniref:holin n=1 Tax=Gammaproteobacteria TaxID=1236 RepID=UPI002FCA8384
MKDVIHSFTNLSGGATLTGAVSGDILIGLAGLALMALFGGWGAYLRYKDSKALRAALESGDVQTAIKIRSKI